MSPVTAQSALSVQGSLLVLSRNESQKEKRNLRIILALHLLSQAPLLFSSCQLLHSFLGSPKESYDTEKLVNKPSPQRQYPSELRLLGTVGQGQGLRVEKEEERCPFSSKECYQAILANMTYTYIVIKYITQYLF